MLTNIMIKNVGSIKDNVELNFSRGRYNFKENMLFNNNNSINPIGIFGSNGSGKTILLRTIHTIANLMVEQTSDLRGFLPNLPNNSGLNSLVKLEFKIDNVEYTYEIETNISEIFYESLTVGDVILNRTNAEYFVKNKGEIIKNGLIEGKLYSAVRQIGIEEYSKESPLYHIKQAYSFLSSIMYIDVRGEVYGKVVSQKSIEDIMVDKSELVNKIISEYKEFPTYTLKMHKLTENQQPHLMFSLDGKHYLPKELMSNGMKAHSTILSTILSMNKGGLLIIDELERSLHPFVAKQFIETLNEKFQVQVIFTSHNTNILQSLRPDQIFFSKWDKRNQTSTYMKLSDIYPNIREVNNIEKMYYGGLLDE